MSSIQTLYGALVAIAVVVGISAALTLAFLAAGALFGRGTVRAARASSVAPAQEPAESDDARVLVLR